MPSNDELAAQRDKFAAALLELAKLANVSPKEDFLPMGVPPELHKTMLEAKFINDRR